MSADNIVKQDSQKKSSGTIVDNRSSSPEISEAERFDQIAKRAQRTIFATQSVFPLDLFPDKLIIDENKVDISLGKFIGSREVYSIPLQNINGARSNSSIIFAGIGIEVEGYNLNPPEIRHLWKRDAITARRIINGLVTAIKQEIDLSQLDLKSLREKLIDIGRASERPGLQ